VPLVCLAPNLDSRSRGGTSLTPIYALLQVKNVRKYFSFEVQVLDDKNVRRRFRASNYQSATRVKPFICTMPMRLDDGWNQIQFNLADFTRRAYGERHAVLLGLCRALCCIGRLPSVVQHGCVVLVERATFANQVLAAANASHCDIAGTNYLETLRVLIHANCR